MKRTRLLFLLALLYFALQIPKVFSQQVVYDWKHEIPGFNFTALCCMTSDSAGNVYVGGRIDSVVTFLDTTLTHDYATGFLAKVDIDGNMVWFKQFEHSNCIYSICFDSENMLYLSGRFTGKVQINDTVFPTYDSDTNFMGMFLAKLKPNGDLVWAKTTGGSFYYETGYGKLKQMTIDHEDNILVVGYGIGELEYFDTTAVYTRPLDSAWVTTPFPHWVYYYNYTNYLAKFDKNGQKQWVRDLGFYGQKYYAIAADYDGNILLTGEFINGDTVVFDTIIVVSDVGKNIFIAKYSSNGQVLWGQRAGGVSYNDLNQGFDLCSDLNNNIYLTGRLKGGGGEFGDSVFNSLPGNGNALLAKYTGYGEICWVRSIGSVEELNYNYGFDLENVNDTLYLCGFFADSLLFGFANMISTQKMAGMVLKYDTNGVIHAAVMDAVPDQAVEPIELTLINADHFYIAGNAGYYDGNWWLSMFFGKFSKSLLSSIEFISDSYVVQCAVYPNPCRGNLNIAFTKERNGGVKILNTAGAVMLDQAFNGLSFSIDLSAFPTGIYLVCIQYDGNTHVKRIVKL